MERLNVLRNVYLPKFQRLAEQFPVPLSASYEFAYGHSGAAPGEGWQWSEMANLGNGVGGRFSHPDNWETREAYRQWRDIAVDGTKQFGDWLIELGIDNRAVKLKGGVCSWFCIFRHLSDSGIHRHCATYPELRVKRDPKPIISQPVDDAPGRPGWCYSTSERIVVDDLLLVSQLSIYWILERGKLHQERHGFNAGPTKLRCSACAYERDVDPYNLPTRCINCGGDYVEGAVKAEVMRLPLGYDNEIDLEMDAWIYETKQEMTWPQLIGELAKVGPEKKWPVVTTEQALRDRLKRYYPNVLKKAYEPGERGNPENKRKARQKRESAGKPKA